MPNNGTLRLPLKPVGLHSDEDTPIIETPSDPPEPEATNTTTRASNTTPTPTTAETPEPTSAASDASNFQLTERRRESANVVGNALA
jgi:hypothetical protein